MSSIRFLLLSTLISMGVMSCSGAEPTVRIVPTASPTATPIITQVVATVVPTATETLPTPTSTPEPTATSTPEPTATARPTATPTATATPEPVLGSRNNPVPIGVSVEIQTGVPTEHWELTILETTPDAWEVIIAENQFNDPPQEGHQFYMVRVRAKYLGPDSTMMLGNLDMKTLGDSSVVYSGFDTYCGVIPDELDEFTELFTGGQLEGNDCW